MASSEVVFNHNSRYLTLRTIGCLGKLLLQSEACTSWLPTSSTWMVIMRQWATDRNLVLKNFFCGETGPRLFLPQCVKNKQCLEKKLFPISWVPSLYWHVCWNEACVWEAFFVFLFFCLFDSPERETNKQSLALSHCYATTVWLVCLPDFLKLFYSYCCFYGDNGWPKNRRCTSNAASMVHI